MFDKLYWKVSNCDVYMKYSLKKEFGTTGIHDATKFHARDNIVEKYSSIFKLRIKRKKE